MKGRGRCGMHRKYKASKRGAMEHLQTIVDNMSSKSGLLPFVSAAEKKELRGVYNRTLRVLTITAGLRSAINAAKK